MLPLTGGLMTGPLCRDIHPLQKLKKVKTLIGANNSSGRGSASGVDSKPVSAIPKALKIKNGTSFYLVLH